ncbi:hypothetical protein ACFLWJ_01500 [Chloroflexota bacterium]
MLQRAGAVLIITGIIIGLVYGIYSMFKHSFTSVPLPLQIAIIVFAVGFIAVLVALTREKYIDLKKGKRKENDDHRYYGPD